MIPLSESSGGVQLRSSKTVSAIWDELQIEPLNFTPVDVDDATFDVLAWMQRTRGRSAGWGWSGLGSSPGDHVALILLQIQWGWVASAGELGSPASGQTWRSGSRVGAMASWHWREDALREIWNQRLRFRERERFKIVGVRMCNCFVYFIWKCLHVLAVTHKLPTLTLLAEGQKWLSTPYLNLC